MAAQVQAGNRKISWQKLNTTQDASFVRDVIARETRSWGSWLLLFGLLQFVPGRSVDPVWGVVLILIAAGSHYFKSAAMLPVYGVTMAWAMVCNLTTGDPRWIVLGLLQAYWAFTTFRQFAAIRGAAQRLRIGLGAGAAGRADRAVGIFPWAGCALSAASATGLVVAIILIAVWPELTGHEMSEGMVDIASAGLLDSACLGVALGVAALLARFPRRAVSILAALGGALLLGFFLLLAFV